MTKTHRHSPAYRNTCTMDSVKTYQKANARNEDAHFGMSRTEDIYARRGGEPDDPHRHNFYTVLVLRKAEGEHRIDFNSYPLGEKQVFFVAPGQVHQIIENRPSEGYVMTFSVDFLIENSIPLSFISDLNLFQGFAQSPPLFPSDNHFQIIHEFCEKMYALFTGNQSMRFVSIGAYLKLLLIQCSTICDLESSVLQREEAANTLIRNFKRQVDEFFREQHTTSFYAERLNITPDHLNRSFKSKTGRTAKEYIQSRIITEAKRLLYFTDLSNKEIGFQLGFTEPANFSAFFKKQTQLSPSRFRKEQVLA